MCSVPFLVYKKCSNVGCYYYCYVLGDLTENILVLEYLTDIPRPHDDSAITSLLSTHVLHFIVHYIALLNVLL